MALIQALLAAHATKTNLIENSRVPTLSGTPLLISLAEKNFFEFGLSVKVTLSPFSYRLKPSINVHLGGDLRAWGSLHI